MKNVLLSIVLLAVPLAAMAQTPDQMIRGTIDQHILPRFEGLAVASQRLADTAEQDCNPVSDALRAAYEDALDAWVSASHLRFGPTEADDRAFALAFWPDSRGATPRSLSNLIADQDPIATSPQDYVHVSIAARGFYALEFLLYDAALRAAGDPEYHCTLIQTVTSDIANTANAILEDWQSDYVATMLEPGPDATYRSDEEALQEIFKALTAGLQFTSETRLGRPLGTFDRPRPIRAEARRSGRSARHVVLSLVSLQDLAKRLAVSDPDLSVALDDGFDRVLSRLADLNDPVFAGVAEPQGRLKVEVIQQSVDTIRAIVRDEVGPTLGVASGFNSLDGD